MNDFDLRKYLADNRLLKEATIKVGDKVDVKPGVIDDFPSDQYVYNVNVEKINGDKLTVKDINDDEYDVKISDVEKLNENKLIKEDQTDLFVKAGFSFDDGLLGGVGSGGGGYYDFISDKISGYYIDKFDEEEFNNWYDNFSKKDFNSIIYNSKKMEDYEIDPSGLPKGIHQLDTAGAGEVMDDMITIYAYPTLVDENGGEFITIFSLDKDGNIVPEISKEEVKAKLASNEYSII
jgi:hypothetical protein